MGHAITLNSEILNQAGYPVKTIISESNAEISTDGEFYSFGDMVIRVELVQSIVKMKDTTLGQKDSKIEVLHG